MASKKTQGPPGDLRPSPTGWTWVARDGGYALVPLNAQSEPGRARLERRAGPKGGQGDWYLMAAGKEVNLGKKATFDSAERALARLGVAQQPPVKAKPSATKKPPAAAPKKPPTPAQSVDKPAAPVASKPVAPKPAPAAAAPAKTLARPKQVVGTGDPIATLNRNKQEAVRLASVKGVDATRKMLERTQRELDERLKTQVQRSGDDTFTAVQMRQALEQVRAALREFQGGLGNAVQQYGGEAARYGAEDTVRYLKEADRKFRGVAQPMQIREAAMLDRAVKGADSTLLNRLQTDDKAGPGILDRYGDAVIKKFEETLQQRFLQGMSWSDARNKLTDDSPFLRGAPASWAERILRTEVMAAHNKSGLEVIQGVDEEDGGMLKILVATFDGRTGADSYAVHGQIRRPSEPFQDWHHSYQAPPNRPNDREIVVAHAMHWPIPESFRWKSDAEVAARWRELGNKKALPARPQMTTVPLDQIGPNGSAAKKKATTPKAPEVDNREAERAAQDAERQAKEAEREARKQAEAAEAKARADAEAAEKAEAERKSAEVRARVEARKAERAAEVAAEEARKRATTTAARPLPASAPVFYQGNTPMAVPRAYTGKPLTNADIRALSERFGELATPEQANAITRFTGSDFIGIRQSEVDAQGRVKPLDRRGPAGQQIAKALEAAKAAGLAPPVETWRGIKAVDVSKVQRWLDSASFDHGGTASTTLARHTAIQFAGHGVDEMSDDLNIRLNNKRLMNTPDNKVDVIFKMNNRSGIPTDVVSTVGDGEQELLVPAGVRYRITGSHPLEGSEGRVMVIEGEEIED